MKQKIRNAWGTMAILNSILNIPDYIKDSELTSDSFLDNMTKWNKGKLDFE